MSEGFGAIDRVLHGIAMRRWARAARGAAETDLSTLRRQRSRARSLRQKLDDLIHVADRRMAMPHNTSEVFGLPVGADWSCRPHLWRRPLRGGGVTVRGPRTTLAEGVAAFHDCTTGEMSLRQLRNTRPEDLAAFGLRAEVFHFDGSFLSVVLDLPPEACVGLTRRHLLRIETVIESERPVAVSLRINVRCGPNTEQLIHHLQPGQSQVEFDLAYAELNEKRIEAVWLDLILNMPAMNAITIRDLTICRYPRAEF